MYVYSTNSPPKKPSPWRRLFRGIYLISGVVAVGMALSGALALGGALPSVASLIYGLALLAALLYRMVKKRMEADLRAVNIALHALLLMAAAFSAAISWIMPAESSAWRVIPTLMALPCAACAAIALARALRP